MAVPDTDRRSRKDPGVQPTGPILAIPGEQEGLRLTPVPKGASKQRRSTSLRLLRIEAGSGALYPIVLGKSG
jgi:hypothetical protein